MAATPLRIGSRYAGISGVGGGGGIRGGVNAAVNAAGVRKIIGENQAAGGVAAA